MKAIVGTCTHNKHAVLSSMGTAAECHSLAPILCPYSAKNSIIWPAGGVRPGIWRTARIIKAKTCHHPAADFCCWLCLIYRPSVATLMASCWAWRLAITAQQEIEVKDM